MNKLLALLGLLLLCMGSDQVVAAAEKGAKPGPPVESALWATPRELRTKKVIGSGMYTGVNIGDANTPTPKFLVDHPDYTANHPFDGVAIPVSLDIAWCKAQGLVSGSAYGLHRLVMSKLPLSYSVLKSAVKELNSVSWGHVTDNFLMYGVSDGTRDEDLDIKLPVDPGSSSDWAVVAKNAALCARLCREAKLKGFMMDTEMYSNYASGELYPFGKGTPETWRERGQVWIKAVQAEFPAIKIIFYFSWGPEHEPGGWPGYENLKYFMNGILAGIEPPARLIHGWESTFWYGGTRILDGKPYVYPGNRAAYARDRNNIKNVWRNLSDNPSKYDRFVDAGMAAWVESDPYNLWPGQPSGFRTQLPWSNLSYTLAYSDEYVWVWSEQTNYPATRDVLNPFLASLANQTFNTGREAVTSLTEDFASNPMQKGWYFDFDMLDIGREVYPGNLPAMTTDAVPYAWSPESHSVRIRGASMSGPKGDILTKLNGQRRRYVHPIKPLSRKTSFHAELDFRVDSFGSDVSNPIVLGLFSSDQLLNHQSVTLQITGPGSARVIIVGDGTSWVHELHFKGSLNADKTYRASFDYDGNTGRFNAALKLAADSSPVARVKGVVPESVGRLELDEVGAAMWDVGETSTPVENAYSYSLERVTLRRK